MATFFNGAARAALPASISGRPGAAWFQRGTAEVAFDFTIEDGIVHRIDFRASLTYSPRSSHAEWHT